MRTCQLTSHRLPELEEAGVPGGTGRVSSSLMRRWPWSSRSAETACMSCSGDGVHRRSKGCGRCPAARWGQMSVSARPWGGIWPPRSTSPTSPTWSSSRPAVIRDEIPGAACWPRPTWPWYPPTSSRASRRIPRGTLSRTFRRPRSTTGRLPSRGENGCGPSCPTPTSASRWPLSTFTIAQLRDIYAATVGHPVSATNLQRVLIRRGVIEATPAAARPTPLGGRPATLYRFAARTLIVTNPFAAFRPPSPPQTAAR